MVVLDSCQTWRCTNFENLLIPFSRRRPSQWASKSTRSLTKKRQSLPKLTRKPIIRLQSLSRSNQSLPKTFSQKLLLVLLFSVDIRYRLFITSLLMQKKAKTAVKPTPKADSSDSSDSDESEEKPASKANGKVLLILAALPCCLYFLTHPEESKGHCQADTKSRVF
jgi:hypothetical protein